MPRLAPLLLINAFLVAFLFSGAGSGQNASEETVPSSSTLVEISRYPRASSAPPDLNDVRLVVRRIEVQHEAEGSAVEITSSGALIPNITKLDGPPRLVIDLPESVAAAPKGSISVQAPDIKGIQLTQYQDDPPITRIVVDLNESRSYFWEAIENKLVVHVRPPEPASSGDPASSEVAFTKGTEPLVSSGSGGTGVVVPAGDFAPGSAVTAGTETTILNLARGGQVRVCPGTTISVSGSHTGQDVMLAMSTGALEAHYNHGSPADSILTPDFRILLPGAGPYHYAVSADLKGNTCVRTLPGNGGSAIVSELIGDGTYQIQPNEQVVFHSGQLSKVDTDIPIDCGCPTQQVPVLRAEAAPVSVPESTPAGHDVSTASLPAASQSESTKAAMAMQPMSGLQPNRSLPPDVTLTVAQNRDSSDPNSRDVRLQVDAPLVFRASQPPPAPVEEAGNLPAVSAPRAEPLKVVVQPPTAAQKREPKPGIFGHIKNFFKTLFG